MRLGLAVAMLATALLVGCADKHPHVLFTAVTTTDALPCSDLSGVAPGSVVRHADCTYAFEMNEHASIKDVAAAAACLRSAQGVSGVNQKTVNYPVSYLEKRSG